MANYYCDEDAKNLVELEIKNRKEALKLYPNIIEVVEKFNGKILNKRFDTALKKADERLCYDRRYNFFEITMNVYNSRSCKSVKTDSLGYSNCNYLYNDKICLNSICYTYSNNPNEKVLLHEERMDSSVLIEALNNKKEHIEKEIEELENAIPKVENWRMELQDLHDEINLIMKEIPYLIREYYHNIDCKVSFR